MKVQVSVDAGRGARLLTFDAPEGVKVGELVRVPVWVPWAASSYDKTFVGVVQSLGGDYDGPVKSARPYKPPRFSEDAPTKGEG